MGSLAAHPHQQRPQVTRRQHYASQRTRIHVGDQDPECRVFVHEAILHVVHEHSNGAVILQIQAQARNIGLQLPFTRLPELPV